MNRYFLISSMFVLVLFIYVALSNENTPYNKVKKGESVLVCYINNSYKDIPKEKVVGLDDEHGIWIFSNGYAKNCRVISNKKDY